MLWFGFFFQIEDYVTDHKLKNNNNNNKAYVFINIVIFHTVGLSTTFNLNQRPQVSKTAQT